VLHWQFNSYNRASVSVNKSFHELTLIEMVGETANKHSAVVEDFTFAFALQLHLEKGLAKPQFAEAFLNHVGLTFGDKLNDDVSHTIRGVWSGDSWDVFNVGNVQVAVDTVN
jgi:hypothetical protein